MTPTHYTFIDTIGFRINCSSDIQQRDTLHNILTYLQEEFCTYIDAVPYSVGFDTRMEYKIYCNNTTVLSFTTGYSNNSYYINIRFAGLKSYHVLIDNVSYFYLHYIVSYLNYYQIGFKLSELDVAIDVHHFPFENLLAICTSKTSRTMYHKLGEAQPYDGETTYIEKFTSAATIDTALKRAYLYDKTKKEVATKGNNIDIPVVRFEVKLQSSYFNKYGFDLNKFNETLNMYHLLYFYNMDEKYALIDKFNSYSVVRKREINRMGLEQVRLHFDINYIYSFINTLLNITPSDTF
ncbi:MAG: hypothetical protein AB7D38_10560 [Sulfurimonas sp.]|uniref:hypothetical protein n=1 Tax=Sulfurimonas sp. TaxID=2022749 RepID=UPI003D1096F7